MYRARENLRRRNRRFVSDLIKQFLLGPITKTDFQELPEEEFLSNNFFGFKEKFDFNFRVFEAVGAMH